MVRYIITLLVLIENLFSIGVTAGTKIEHVAYLDYTLDSIEMKTHSNKLIDIVDQKLDMNFLSQENGPIIVEPNDKKRAIKFRITNNGNGSDTYLFTPIKGDTLDFNVENVAVYKDNGDDFFSETEDKVITKLPLKADESATLFLVADIPKDAEKFSENGIRVSSLLQGDMVYGESKKLEKYHVVVANTEEANVAYGSYEVPSIVLELEKSATLSSDKLYKRSTIHYTIGVKAIGTGRVDDVVVKDVIPKGTKYVPHSLKLDGKSIDGYDGSAVLVTIDSISQKEESNEVLHSVTFDVRVE